MSRCRARIARWAGSGADLADDVLVELASRRFRAVLMVVAVGLSTGALQASAGLSEQASLQIGADIAASTLDLVSVSVVPHAGAGGSGASAAGDASVEAVLPEDTEARLERISAVRDGGRRLDVSAAVSPVITRLPGGTGGDLLADQVPDVVAVTSGYLRAAGVDGPADLSFFLDRNDPVVFLGSSAATALGVPETADPVGLQVWIDGQPYDVVGFIADSGSAGLDHAVVLPYAVGLAMVEDDSDSSVLVRTEPGAGSQVASVIVLALRPDAPERLEASQVVSVSDLRRGVSTQMSKLAAWTGTVLVALTTLLIANSMVVSVMARMTEIGLRRALGYSRHKVGGVFLAEGLLIGFLGGLVGSAFAAMTVVAAAVLNGWTAVLEPAWIGVGPAIGVMVGLLASAYPARRAAGISPALAVRSE